jgi:tetratricopeptide (TPR) repeat protein
MKMICPLCCAGIRKAGCAPCSFYHTAENYHAEKYQKSGGRSFKVELDQTIENLVDKALGQIEKKHFDRAEESLMGLQQSHPDNHYVNYGMGVLYAFKGENKKAIDHFKKSIEIFPYFVEAHYNLGIAYHKEVNISNMVRSFRNVLRMCAPDDICYSEAKRLLASIEQMIREVNGTDMDTFINAQDIFEKGMRLMETGEWAQAIEAYKDSLALNASTPQPYGNMGLCYARIGKKEAAIEAFDKALAIDPNYELAIVNKMHTKRLAPGEILDAPLRIVEYYKDYSAENRSYIEELAQETKLQLGHQCHKLKL